MKTKNKPQKAEHFLESLNRLPFMLLIVSLTFACICFLPVISKPLLGPHSFRQTQNAISSFYTVKQNAPIWENIMPVCGPPWNLPTEFPLYQYLSAKLHLFSAIPLDMSGRILSIIFFFAAVFVAFALVRKLEFSFPQSALIVPIVVSSPVYLFWGVAYLMETTALFLAMTYILFSIKFLENFLCNKEISLLWRNPYALLWITLALFSGILCALQKGTTWVSAAGVFILLVLWKWRRSLIHQWIKISLALGVLCFFPLALASRWISYGDSLKMKNPLARELFVVSSPNHSRWNYGTLHQKLDSATWEHILRHISDQLLVPLPGIGSFFIIVILVFGAFCYPKRIPLILILLAGFLSGPLIFTNLYFEHSYYWCANGIWLLLAAGTAIAGIWECAPKSNWSKLLALVITISVCSSGFLSWYKNFYPITKSLPTLKQLAEVWIKPVQEIVPPERTILILGNDWNPNSLYYAERKGIAFPTADWIPLPGPQLEESLKNLGPDEQLGAVVVNEQLLTSTNQAFFTDFLQRLGMSLEGKRTAFGILFPAVDLNSRK
jgi:hypothetical protein